MPTNTARIALFIDRVDRVLTIEKVQALNQCRGMHAWLLIAKSETNALAVRLAAVK
jgi:hypothetical protein